MKHAVIFILVGVCFAIEAMTYRGPWLMLQYPAMSFVRACV